MFNKKTLNKFKPVDAKLTFWHYSWISREPDVRIDFDGDVRELLKKPELSKMHGLQSPRGATIKDFNYNGTKNITQVHYVFFGGGRYAIGDFQYKRAGRRAARFYKKTQQAITARYLERIKQRIKYE